MHADGISDVEVFGYQLADWIIKNNVVEQIFGPNLHVEVSTLVLSCKLTINNNNNGWYIYEPIAIDTLGVLNTSARQLLCDLGRKISEHTGEVRETSFLFQRCSVLVQRFNAILLHDSIPAFDCTG